MLCTTTTKPPLTSKFYVDFKKIFFKDPKNVTHLSIFRCFAPCQVDLWAEALPFSAVLPPENTQTSPVAIFFYTPVLPHHSKTTLSTYWGKRSFLGVAKSWKVTLDRVPWFGHHVENLGTSSYIQFWLWPGLDILKFQHDSEALRSKLQIFHDSIVLQFPGAQRKPRQVKKIDQKLRSLVRILIHRASISTPVLTQPDSA